MAEHRAQPFHVRLLSQWHGENGKNPAGLALTCVLMTYVALSLLGTMICAAPVNG